MNSFSADAIQSKHGILQSQRKMICVVLGVMLMMLSTNSPAFTCFAQSVSSPAYNITGPWAGTNSYAVNDVVSYGGNLYVNIQATAPASVASATNLFDLGAVVDGAVITTATGATANIGGFQSSGYIDVSGIPSFVTNITIGIFDPYGLAFYDANRAFVSGSSLNGNGYFPAGVPIAVPAGVHYVRFWWQTTNMGTSLNSAMVDAGAILPSSYSAFGTPGTTTTTPCASPTDTTHWAIYTPATSSPTPVATGPGAGKKMFMLGDSIVWANPAVAGQIATAIGATLSSKGATAPGVDAFPGRTFAAFMNGQGPAGYLPLSASVLADVDLLVIALGTNQDSSAGIGSISDSPSLNGSLCAEMRAMLETIMGWKPGMRIVVVGPYQSNRYNVPAGTDGLLGTWYGDVPPANASSLAVLKNINVAMKSVCELYAIPYIDAFDQSGVNFTTSAIWLADGLHPNALGYSRFYVPYISAQLSRFVQ